MRPRAAFLLPFALLLAACGSSDGTATSPPSGDAVPATAEAGVGDGAAAPQDPFADAPALVPDVTFALEDPGTLQGVAISPDGASLVATHQVALGDPVTLRLYDVATGEVRADAEVATLRIGLLHWMADNRIVAATTESVGDSWRSWDGASLDELATLPLDLDCGEGRHEKSTGAIYSASGDGLCRADTSDGTTQRSPALPLASDDYLWVRSGANEVAALLDGTGEDGSSRLVVLDGGTWAEKSSTTVPFETAVLGVGSTAWLDDRATGTAVLDPGAIPVPVIRDTISVSDAGTVFLAATGGTTLVLVSAVDGSVLGAAGLSGSWPRRSRTGRSRPTTAR